MTDSAEDKPGANRRDFLTGKAIRHEIERRGDALADELTSGSRRIPPPSRDTVRLATQAMNCEFAVVLNPSRERRALITASDALEMVHPVESQLTVYRETSDLLELNRTAGSGACVVSPELFALLQRACDLALETGGAFNPLAAPLNALWRECRRAGRVPTDQELAQALQLSDPQGVEFDADGLTITLPQLDMGFDLGGMGKGYALDQMAAHLAAEEVEDFMVYGGHSSILVRGKHLPTGWPIGIRHPQFPQRRLATWVLTNRGFSASGSAVQYFRYAGKRYGHIFDPRTGWPVEHMLSVAVTAPTAAQADALSTAFSVMSLEETITYCAAHPEISALLLPPPPPGKPLRPLPLNIDPESLYWE
jgi:FAD:protein FMN transferase